MPDTLRTTLICLALVAAYCLAGTLDYRQAANEETARSAYLDCHETALIGWAQQPSETGPQTVALQATGVQP
jgi:hypothetical protein